MAERFTIEIPEEKAQTMREIARLAKEPIERVIAELAQNQIAYSETIDTQLEEVNRFSTILLWSLVQRGLGFPPTLDKRMLDLIQKGKEGVISDTEQTELEELVVIYDKYVLLRTEALVELQERGYDIQHYLKENSPKS
jgi:hypothetical protein